MTKLLSEKQCDNFLSTQLQFPEWKKALNKDRLEFLKTFTTRHMENIYYQNVSILTLPTQRRHLQTKGDIILCGLEGKGGACLELNYFAKKILTSLGFEAWLAQAHCTSVPNVEINHCVIIVQLSKRQSYLVDFGQFHPLLSPVPLFYRHGEHPLPLHKGEVLGFSYDYQKCPKVPTSENSVERSEHFARFHYKGRCSTGEFSDRDSEKFMTFNLTRRNYSFLANAMSSLYSGADPRQALFNRLLLCRFITAEPENPELVMITGKTMVRGGRKDRVVKHFENYNDPELKETILRYFPKLEPDQLHTALENLQVSEELSSSCK